MVWCEVAIIWSDIYICIMYVRYTLYDVYKPKCSWFPFLLWFFFFPSNWTKHQGPKFTFSFGTLAAAQAIWCSVHFPAPDALAPPIGRLVQEEKLRHLGCNAVKTGCSCLDGFENSRVQPWLFFLSAGFQGWSSSSPIFFTPFFPGKHQTCLERTLQSWCILYFQAV